MIKRGLKMNRLEGKKSIIVGGSRGIGKAISKLFAQENAKIIVVGASDAGEATAEEIRIAGGDAEFIKADATDESQVKELFEKVKTKFGTLDIGINCLGKGASTSIIETSAETFDLIMKTNLYSHFYCMKEEFSLMKSGAVIVNISSLNSTVANNYQGPYCTSKAGLDMLSKVAALEMGPKGIRVCTINPGLTKTELVKKYTDNEDVMEDFMFKIPLRRLGQPEDIAKAALFLCSDEASYITATSLYVDGGMAPEGYSDATLILHNDPVPRGQYLKRS